MGLMDPSITTTNKPIHQSIHQTRSRLPALAALNLACNPHLDVGWLARGLSDPDAAPRLASLDVAFTEAPEGDL